MNKWIKASVAALAVVSMSVPAMAAWPDKRPITFIIPYSPGGGFDTISRAFLPAVEKELGTNVVPKNVPGAGGTKGAATVARAQPDGYTIGIYNIPGYIVSDLLGKNIGFDLNKVTWIANLATESYGLAVKAGSDITSIDELCKLGRPVKLSDTGLDSTSSIAARIVFKEINCPTINVTGYKGSNDTMIGVMRGEVDATLKPISSLMKYVKSGDLKLILTLTKGTVADGVQNATEMGHPEFAKFDVRRVVAGPGGLPADITQKLSDAFIAAGKSDKIQTWAKGAGVSLDLQDTKATSGDMGSLGAFYAKYKADLK